MNDENWKTTVWAAADRLKSGDPNMRVSMILDDMAGADRGVYSAVTTSRQRMAAGIGGATDREIVMFYDMGVMDKVDFYIGGVLQKNPFG